MTALCAGWKVVCPDGSERHFPYHNHGDALCDASVFDKSPEHCTRYLEPPVSACPGGAHAVEPIAFMHGEHGGTGQS